ncbi:3-deoxy-7-phosphoheptulonate synthase [Thermosulfuriphilus ammonigenes]|uniref:3-deoxy-7-phosphoheptulonate synthase n=1 Tax=Thermosulfuriphilus ammonigenes TaxID=1936021 RepID=A0A6G7PVE3_9BACT|nr:3-deoxy-7-phosphoheptulonate synthase [Thermosulfuriphilus ammonigenes]MBA2848171.1 3-deoxy-7-phosphoheptulonate synthase [Thermosulfuriphilus ammonigenes]QIJ71654.1 3-deoxy-7-phosphoheptulonate synthase [Thermosulfuriphilus ammonigenes]
MIIILKQDLDPHGPEVKRILDVLHQYEGITTRLSGIRGTTRTVMELYVIGPTAHIPDEEIQALPGVEKVIRVSKKYRLIGRHQEELEGFGFDYNGLHFDQDSFHIFAGLCAVDTRENVARIFAALKEMGISTSRMGAYKPRTNPYSFQGHGKKCLPWLFELAGKYNIRCIAMEVTKESHIEEIRQALEEAGRPTGIMLQIGTRNAQNFELLKAVGQQDEFPVLYKRGMGITIEEALNACEYIASEGNRNIIFCLRGVKTNLGDPHRNLIDFGHVPVIKRLTRLPVCVDPTHSVGIKEWAPDGILDIFHAAAQGIIAGANMILVEFHPRPEEALCDGPQALTLEELPHFVADMALVREAYLRRKDLAARYRLKAWAPGQAEGRKEALAR